MINACVHIGSRGERCKRNHDHGRIMITVKPTPLSLGDGMSVSSAWTLNPDVLHLNHGSFGAVPARIQDFQNHLRAEMDVDPVRWFTTLAPRVVQARGALAGFLGTDPACTAVVPNVTAGASAVFHSVRPPRGPDIVVTDHGYGAVTMGAERAATRWGGRLITAEVPINATFAEAHDIVMSSCTATTGLIVVDQITSATARRMPVIEIAASARERGIRTLVDGAHAPGLHPKPLEDLDCDYWIGAFHKWPCAPRGAAVLIARRDVAQELFPVIDSWGTPLAFPERFDVQGTLDFTSYLAAPASIQFVEDEWGWDRVRSYMSDLADYAARVIAEAFSIHTGEDHRVDVAAPVNAMRLVRLPAGLATTHAQADALRLPVRKECNTAAALTSFRGIGYLRLSAHVYGTTQDYDEAAERLVPRLCEWALTSVPP